MLKFIKGNSKIILRLLLSQIGMTIFGLMISMTMAAIETAKNDGKPVGPGNHVWLLWASVFAVLFYLFICYAALFDEGQRDKIRIEAGRMPYKPAKGFFIALCAAAPNFIFALLVVITGFLGSESGPFAFAWAGGASGILKLVALLFQGMYWGIMLQLSRADVVAAIQPYWYILITLPLLATGLLGYFAGLKDASLKNAIKKAFTPEQSTGSAKDKSKKQ